MTPVILSRKGGGGTGGTGTAQALSIGVSTGGNTAGNTAVSTGSRFVIVGSGDITASQATAAGATTVTLSGGAAQALSIGVSTGGNTSGDTTVNTGSRLVLAGGNNITLSQATAAGATTISISGPNTAGAAGGTVSMWPDQNLRTASINGTILSFTTGATRTTLSAQIFPMVVPANLSLNQIRGIASMSMTSNTTNSHWTYTQGMSMGIYSLNADTISLISSFSNNFVMTYSSAANSTNASASFAFSYGSGTELSSSHSSSTNNAGGANIWSYVSGNRYFPFAQGAVSLADGHYFGVWACSTGSSGAALATLAALGIQDGVSNQGAIASLGTVSNQFLVHSPLGGIVSFTQTNTAMPDSIATANIVTSGAAQFTRYPYFVLGSF